MRWTFRPAEVDAAPIVEEAVLVPLSLPSDVRRGAAVTIAYLVLYYMFLVAQGTMKRKLRAHYLEQGKKFDRYFTRDKKMLGWDRTVGNMMEQSVPFLSLFWLNIYLSSFTELSCSHIMAAGWTYVALRSLYPVLWFGGGGGPSGTSPLIWRITIPMYAIILFFAINATIAIRRV